MSATCRSCGAAIMWCVTAANKRMPLDATPATLFVIVGATDDDTPIVETKRCFTSHFASCPAAAQHRKPRESAS